MISTTSTNLTVYWNHTPAEKQTMGCPGTDEEYEIYKVLDNTGKDITEDIGEDMMMEIEDELKCERGERLAGC